MDRLVFQPSKGPVSVQECSLADLLTISERAPGKLGSGELSCIAAAYHPQHCGNDR